MSLHQNHEGQLSFEEYEMILAALVEGASQQGVAGLDTVNVQLLQREQVTRHKIA